MLFDDMCPRGAVSAGARSAIVGSCSSLPMPPNNAFNRTVSGGGLRRRRHGRL